MINLRAPRNSVRPWSAVHMRFPFALVVTLFAIIAHRFVQNICSPLFKCRTNCITLSFFFLLKNIKLKYLHVVRFRQLNVVLDHFFKQLIVIAFQLLPLHLLSLFADLRANLAEQRLDVVQLFHIVCVQLVHSAFDTHLPGLGQIIVRFVQPQEHHRSLRIFRLHACHEKNRTKITKYSKTIGRQTIYTIIWFYSLG